MPIEVGLVIKQPYIDQILSGRKTWEIRGTSTKKRGTIALLESGGNRILGYADLVEVVGPLTKAQMIRNTRKSMVTASDLKHGTPYARTFAWVVAKPRRLKRPKPFKNPPGAVVWVRLR